MVHDLFRIGVMLTDGSEEEDDGNAAQLENFVIRFTPAKVLRVR